MSTNNKALTAGNRLALDSATMNTLATVVDPYSDRLLRSTGYPDGHSTISALQRFYDRITVECPFSLSVGEMWDFHIFTTPLHHKAPLLRCVREGNVMTYNNALSDETFGPITVKYQKYNSAGATIGTPIYVGLCPMPVDSSMSTSGNQYRTVSLAFELHNITPKLYAGGSLTSYRTPVVDQKFSGWSRLTGASVTLAVPHATDIIATYPFDLTDMAQYPNTRTWEAEEGIYAVALPDPNNSYGQMNNSNFMLLGVDGANTARSRPQVASLSSFHVTHSPIANVGVMSSRFKDTNQIFTLDYRHNIEVIPDPSDTQMVSFATTSPERDEVFLKLYTRMFNSIPPGVPVDFNAAGEWFRRMIQVAKIALPHVVPFLPPQLKAIAGPVRVGLEIADRLTEKKEQKKKPGNSTALVVSSQTKSGRMLPAKRQ